MGCRDVEEGCPASCSGLVLAAELARQCPGLRDVRAPGQETSFVLHRLGFGLCSSIIPAHCSQLISKGICLLRPCIRPFWHCFCSLHPF